MDLALRQMNMRRSLTCPICQKLFRQVTTIDECCHQFCYKCIIKKISEEGSRSCPVCNIDLGYAPLQRLRMGNGWESINENFNEIKREHIEMKGLDVVSSSPFPRQSTPQMPEASSSTHASMRNEKQSWPMEHVEGVRPREFDYNITFPLQQSREVRATQRGEENTNFVATNTCKTFWFSLVASNSQKCKAPLEQIPSRYLRVKDANITVSCIKKYLMQKLNLHSENEVEISLQGRPLLPSLQIWKLVDLWVHTTLASERKTTHVGSSAHDFVLTLTYARPPAFA